MINSWTDKVGDWNPQLLRELKSRFSDNAPLSVVAVTILVQLIGIYFVGNTTDRSFAAKVSSSFDFLNWVIPISLILGSIYAIVSDLNLEERRGTLNFIQLTPQSARGLFIGKIIGVPSLIYLSILLTIPLHLYLGVHNGISLPLMLGWYLTIGTFAYGCWSLVLLYRLHSSSNAILLSLLFALPVNTVISIYNYCVNSLVVSRVPLDLDPIKFSWFYLPIDSNVLLLDVFIVWTLLTISYWLWVTIDRKYINLASTSLRKEDTYWMNITLQIWLLGFAIPILAQIDRSNSIGSYIIVALFYSISTLWIFTIVPLILPNPQSIQEWSRYHHEHVIHKHLQWWQQAIIRDLIWHDRSPIELAILINLLMSAIVWGLCCGVFIYGEFLIRSLCGIIITGILMLIYTSIISFICLQSSTRKIRANPLIILMSCLPLFLGFVAVVNPESRDLSLNLLLFSPLAWIGILYLSIPNIGMIIIGQIGILIRLTTLMQRRLQKLGSLDLQPISQQKLLLVEKNR
jgi:uncharacterized membrane protein YjfL (UPF0719 family)